MLDIEKQTMTPQNKASSFSGFNWDFQLVLVCFNYFLKLCFKVLFEKLNQCTITYGSQFGVN